MQTLEEIDDIFEKADPSKPWTVVKVAHDLPLRAAINGNMDPEGELLQCVTFRRCPDLTLLPDSAAYALRQRFGQKDLIDKPEHMEEK